MQTIITIIVFLLILGSIIIIHELGHFFAAKIFGVYCAHFSIGFGPKIWSKKGKETEYEIRALPFGGFVSMAGEEQNDDEEFKDADLNLEMDDIAKELSSFIVMNEFTDYLDILGNYDI